MNSQKLFRLTWSLSIPAVLLVIAYLILVQTGGFTDGWQMVMQVSIIVSILPPTVPGVIFLFALLAADRHEAEEYHKEGLNYGL